MAEIIYGKDNSTGKGNWFDELEKAGIHATPEQRSRIEAKMKEILSYEPRIGVFGKTGVGKSSLCNALFGADICPISDVEACTRNTKEVLLNMGGNGIKLIDVPGVGENEERDEEYAKLYAQLLPELDLVLWLVKADDRAMASDENFYKNIVKPHLDQGKPFFMVINQVDKIEPFREWDEEKHEPGSKQFQNIYRKIAVIAEQFGLAESKLIPVSASEKYNLTKLVDEIVYALPKEKKVTVFKAVNNEFRSVATGEHVKKSFGDIVYDVFDAVLDVGERVLDKVADKFSGFVEGVGNFLDNVGDFIGSIFGW